MRIASQARPRKWGVRMRSAPFSGTARSQSLSWWLGRTPLWDGLVRVSWAISEVHQISPSMAAMAPMAGSMALVMVRLPHGLEPCYAHMPICLWRSITRGPGTTIFLALDITMDKTIPLLMYIMCMIHPIYTDTHWWVPTFFLNADTKMLGTNHPAKYHPSTPAPLV